MNELYGPHVYGKDDRIEHEWIQAPAEMRALVLFAASLIFDIGGKETIITSIFRDDNPKSVHAHWRGIDLRTRHLPEGIAKEVERLINLSIIYDPTRPHLKTALFHDSGQGEHLHLQKLKIEG